MASTYGKLLLAVYELEGLLLVLEKHGDATPASVVELIKQKAAFVAEEAAEVQFPQQTVEEEMLDAALEGDDDADFAHAAEAESADEEPPAFVKCPDCGKILPSGYTFCNFCGCELATVASPEAPAEEAPEVIVEEIPAPVAPVEEAPAEAPAVPPIDDDIDFVAPEPDVPAADEEEEEEFEEVETEEEEEIFDDETCDDADSADEPLSIEEKLNRGMAKNMRSAFSLNDSIRFRRELFGNSQAEYNDALDMVQSMHSFDEAEDYFYDDLGWDPTNEEVRDFMEVVKRHFL
ncbi:MAG: hypothetical protein Q4B68_06400 [Bacteroidales bacterium]|nr:hypothetical protein [Bacteroidales bacterium]